MAKEFLFASHFSGCGGAAWGAKNAGFKPISAIEWDEKRPQIAELYRKNIGEVLYQDIATVNPSDLSIPLPDERQKNNQVLVLQTSPPCQEYSLANRKRNTKSDRANILSLTYEYYRVFRPEYVVLENVVGFQKSQCLGDFKAFLGTLGYRIKELILNSADFGVAQTRKRLFLIATKKGFKMPTVLPTHTNGGSFMYEDWCGWYEQIEDLVDGFSSATLTKNQTKIIAKSSGDIRSIIMNDAPNITARFDSNPIFTLSTRNRTKALLIERIGYRNGEPKIKCANEPFWTLRAGIGDDGKGGNHVKIIDAILENGKVVTLNARALARLQGFDDSYQLLGDNKYDIRGIGNSVCPPVMQRICEAIKLVS